VNMKLDARAFGLAAGTTAAALFILCALAVAIAPGATTAFAGYLIHTDLSGLSRSLTLGNFVGGLVCWAFGTALTFWLVAAIYNRLLGVRSTAPAPGPRPAVQGV
jgi:hypothetical protein